MLTKKQFKKLLDRIIYEEERQQKLDKALQEYAPSDFTGFYDSDLSAFLLEILADLMDDKYDTISWWLWDAPDRGRCKDDRSCTICFKDEDSPEYVIRTPDDLYDYLVLSNLTSPTKDHLRLAKRAQDNGVKYAISEIRGISDTNKRTKNPGWEERDALLKYTASKIINDYQIAAGANPGLSSDDNIYIICTAEEES